MTIEQEMELWDKRSKDHFGTMLASLKDITADYFVSEANEYGFKVTPFSNLTALYAVDGDRKSVYNKAYLICENYDLLEDKRVAQLIRTMEKLSEITK